MIALLAAQMILARRGPVFPRFIAGRTFQKQRLASMLNSAVPVLRYLERFIRPRWQTPFEMTKRVDGGAIPLVGTLLFAPVPLSNVPPALVIILLAFAYLEEDGVLLCITLAAALVLLMDCCRRGLAGHERRRLGWGAAVNPLLQRRIQARQCCGPRRTVTLSPRQRVKISSLVTRVGFQVPAGTHCADAASVRCADWLVDPLVLLCWSSPYRHQTE